MKLLAVTTQLLEIILAVLAAPLLVGWVNQCRAWLQNRSAPSIWQPYRGLHKLFYKDAVVATNASSLFRAAPYVVFSSMVLAAAIIPSLGTRLPFTVAADGIALVGLLATARVFVPYEIAHPVWMFAFLVLTAVTFSLFGFIIGIWADGFEKLQLVPTLVVTPLTFLGGSFYSIRMLPPAWQKITLFNPVVYLVSGFRWSFYDASDVSVETSFGMTLVFLVLCLVAIGWIFKTGYRFKA